MDDKTLVRTPSPQPVEQSLSPPPTRHKETAPRLPHERDESDDSQVRHTDPRMRQAHADLAAGMTDTDCRGTPGVEAVVHGSAEGKPWCPAAPAGAGKEVKSG